MDDIIKIDSRLFNATIIDYIHDIAIVVINIIAITGFTLKCSFTRTTQMHIAKLNSKLRLKGVLVKEEVKLQKVLKNDR